MNKIISFFLHNRLITALLLALLILWGLATAPFDWEIEFIPSNPVAVDAIPNTGENQQIIFTEWKGRSPQDIDDQITYPLTTYLLGVPGVKSVRSSSMMGFSNIFLIFEEDTEFYWSRSRILEKLNSIPEGLLPEGVRPTLGPDATALGQVFWYTLEPKDANGNTTGGWQPHEIRSAQDFHIKYALSAVEGIAEVASIGGHVKEYQVEVNPSALKQYEVSLAEVANAIRNSNRDVGAKTIEINQAEYFVRGLGYLKSIEDLENTSVKVNNNTPIKLADVAEIHLGPSTRRGVLDKGGAEAVGGVVVVRDGYNPLQAIKNIKEKIEEIQPGMPSKTLADGTKSQLEIVPFYDRSQLIYETISTLEDAISLQVIIAILVVVLLLFNLRASMVISAVLPISVLLVFIMMKLMDIEANIVALSGIAIAIGTMIDLAVILSENIIKHFDDHPDKKKNSERLKLIFEASKEVSGAILTAVATTIVSFVPVFMLQASEGKLFIPLAYTKTFALIAALLVTLFILPSLSYWLMGYRVKKKIFTQLFAVALAAFGGYLLFSSEAIFGLIFMAFGILKWLETKSLQWPRKAELILAVFAVLWLLAIYWLPLGPVQSTLSNLVFVVICLAFILGGFMLLERKYTALLKRCLAAPKTFLLLPIAFIFMGLCVWLGFQSVFYWPQKGFNKIGFAVEETRVWKSLSDTFPGIGKEFMPSLDEGSFLLMPTTMPHAGLEFNQQMLQKIDLLTEQIPEVDVVVGKLGRVESALDPAPISMFENVINYKPEYLLNANGKRMRFEVNEHNHFKISTDFSPDNQSWFFDPESFQLTDDQGEVLPVSVQKDKKTDFLAATNSLLIPDDDGQYFRNWRPKISSTDDIWKEITAATKIPGLTSAPKLQPIETRQIMLQTGMRAPMGIKIFGSSLAEIEDFGLELESILREVPSLRSGAVNAERIVGKPYLNISILRNEIALYGLSIEDVQQHIEMALGGMPITTTVEGRERYQVSLRYPRELRDHPDAIKNVLIHPADGNPIPLGSIAEIDYEQGPQSIKSENTFLVGYVFFDRQSDVAEITAVNDAKNGINQAIENGELEVPSGLNYEFAGNYENQVRAEKRLSLIIPIVLMVIFLILYLQFRSVSTSLMVFLSIALAFSGGFILIWFYNIPSFMDFNLLGANMREVFQIQSVYLSVAVWVGFIALFGIATDDAVLMATYLKQSFERNKTNDIEQIKTAVIKGAQRRIRPAVMTSATTIIALLPVMTSSGKGSEIMIPMAIPAFGGMIVASVTYFLLPTLYYLREKNLAKK
ncbi:MAG: efflux RND transporter permease subunit [Bacteroidota bacterium]